MMRHNKQTEVCVVQDDNATIPPERRIWRLASEPPVNSDSYLYVSPRCADNLGTGLTSKKTSFETLSAEDWALCIIKPDALELGLEERIQACIRNKIARSALVLVENKVNLTEAQLDQIWPAPLDEHGERLPPSPWWEATLEYMQSAPVNVRLVHGLGASATLLGLKAELRREFYGDGYQADETLPMLDRVRSVIHTSDCDKELIGNILAFWDHSIIREAVNSEMEDNR